MTTPEVFLTLSNMQNALLTALFEQMTSYKDDLLIHHLL